jgi:putative peptidoglycan lipid II flippase
MARANGASVSEPEAGRSYAAGIARGAGIIAVITIGSRVVGLARTLTFSQTVGATCVGTAYVTANQIPNLVYELVLGGALSTVMVPLLARSAERSAADREEKEQVSRVTSALLTWCVLLLVPLTLIIVFAAGPVAALLNPHNSGADCVHAQVVATTASMLRIFAPQALLYGLSVVLLGLLQAYRRFAAYALAPLVNSLVVIAACLSFAPLAPKSSKGSLPPFAELVLAAGTTLGVAVMVVVALVPAWRLRLRLRPTLRLPVGIGRRAGGLALVGVVESVATEISAVVVIGLANGRGATGALVLFNYASQVFATLNAVLALSISVSAFPVLSARDGSAFERACAGSTRAVMLVSCLGVALMAAVTVPAAHALAGQHSQVSELALGFICFAPGLIGFGVITNLARAMLAVGQLKIAAAAVGGSILLAMVVQIALAETLPARLVVAGLALGNTVGMTVVAVIFVVVSRRVLGAASIQGLSRATRAGLIAAAGSGLVGAGVSLVIPMHHKLIELAAGTFASVVVVIVFTVIAFRLDDGDLGVILARVTRATGLSLPPQAGGRFGLAYLGALSSLVRRRAGERSWLSRSGRNPGTEDAQDSDTAPAGTAERHPRVLSARERKVAIAVGLVAGVVGGYAVFASSNAAGTVLLLLIALIFLLVGIEGTPLLWFAMRPGAHRTGKRRIDVPAQRIAPESPPLSVTVPPDLAMPEGLLTAPPVISPTGVEDGNSLLTTEPPGPSR